MKKSIFLSLLFIFNAISSDFKYDDFLESLSEEQRNKAHIILQSQDVITKSYGTTVDMSDDVLNKLASLVKDKKVLVLGGGCGKESALLSLKAATVTHNDICLSSVDTATKLFKNIQQENIRTLPGNLFKVLPEHQEEYDVLVIRNVVHFFTEKKMKEFLRLAEGVTKKDGYIFMENKYINGIKNLPKNCYFEFAQFVEETIHLDNRKSREILKQEMLSPAQYDKNFDFFSVYEPCIASYVFHNAFVDTHQSSKKPGILMDVIQEIRKDYSKRKYFDDCSHNCSDKRLSLGEHLAKDALSFSLKKTQNNDTNKKIYLELSYDIFLSKEFVSNMLKECKKSLKIEEFKFNKIKNGYQSACCVIKKNL